jgi:ABC-type nitrate/sulfonate/bicarbonate transport system ATPase subunit
VALLAAPAAQPLWNSLKEAGSMAEPVCKLELLGVSKEFVSRGRPTVSALGEVTLHVPARRFVSIVGPSGCGKSTLFNLIAGLLQPSSGQIFVDGEEVAGTAGLVGYMLQKDMLLPWRTVLDNVVLGLEVQGVARRDSVAAALPLLQRYGLGGFERHYPHSLSGGMRQRVALLRTLLYDREIILLDEPFAALDAQTRLTLQEWLLALWQDFQKTVLLVTHDLDEAIFLSDEVYVMSARPGCIRARLPVDLPRPRDAMTVTTPAFMALKREALTMLSEETRRAQALELAS